MAKVYVLNTPDDTLGLGSWSKHPFTADGMGWKGVSHYALALRAKDSSFQKYLSGVSRKEAQRALTTAIEIRADFDAELVNHISDVRNYQFASEQSEIHRKKLETLSKEPPKTQRPVPPEKPSKQSLKGLSAEERKKLLFEYDKQKARFEIDMREYHDNQTSKQLDTFQERQRQVYNSFREHVVTTHGETGSGNLSSHRQAFIDLLSFFESEAAKKFEFIVSANAITKMEYIYSYVVRDNFYPVPDSYNETFPYEISHISEYDRLYFAFKAITNADEEYRSSLLSTIGTQLINGATSKIAPDSESFISELQGAAKYKQTKDSRYISDSTETSVSSGIYYRLLESMGIDSRAAYVVAIEQGMGSILDLLEYFDIGHRAHRKELEVVNPEVFQGADEQESEKTTVKDLIKKFEEMAAPPELGGVATEEPTEPSSTGTKVTVLFDPANIEGKALQDIRSRLKESTETDPSEDLPYVSVVSIGTSGTTVMELSDPEMKTEQGLIFDWCYREVYELVRCYVHVTNYLDFGRPGYIPVTSRRVVISSGKNLEDLQTYLKPELDIPANLKELSRVPDEFQDVITKGCVKFAEVELSNDGMMMLWRYWVSTLIRVCSGIETARRSIPGESIQTYFYEYLAHVREVAKSSPSRIGNLTAELSDYGVGLIGIARYLRDIRGARSITANKIRVAKAILDYRLDSYPLASTLEFATTKVSIAQINVDELAVAPVPQTSASITDPLIYVPDSKLPPPENIELPDQLGVQPVTENPPSPPITPRPIRLDDITIAKYAWDLKTHPQALYILTDSIDPEYLADINAVPEFSGKVKLVQTIPSEPDDSIVIDSRTSAPVAYSTNPSISVIRLLALGDTIPVGSTVIQRNWAILGPSDSKKVAAAPYL